MQKGRENCDLQLPHPQGEGRAAGRTKICRPTLVRIPPPLSESVGGGSMLLIQREQI